MPAPSLPTVLLVDDEAANRFLLRRHLQRLAAQAHILEAADGAQALALVAQHQAAAAPAEAPPLLVLLDVNMPGMDGLEFLTHYRELPAATQRLTTVVVVSATNHPDERAQAQHLAAALHLKPLTQPQLEAVLRQHLPAALPPPAGPA